MNSKIHYIIIIYKSYCTLRNYIISYSSVLKIVKGTKYIEKKTSGVAFFLQWKCPLFYYIILPM